MIHPWDKVFFRVATFLLFATLTVSRLKIVFFNNEIAPWYQVLLFFDAPFLVVLLVMILLAALRVGGEIRVRNFLYFYPIPLFLGWILLTGFYRAEHILFFASGFAQWCLAYLAFLLVPPLLRCYDLLDYSIDVFLGWSLFAAAAHLGTIVLSPGQMLTGVASVFGGNRAHVGLVFLISFAIVRLLRLWPAVRIAVP